MDIQLAINRSGELVTYKHRKKSKKWSPPGIKTRKKILKKTQGQCYYCRIPLSIGTMTIDHWLPRCFGGKRLVPCCRECNSLKGNMVPLYVRAI